MRGCRMPVPPRPGSNHQAPERTRPMTAMVEAPRGDARPARPASQHPPRSPKRRSGARRHLTPWMMLAPGIVLFTVFMAAPILYTFVLSFQKEMVKGLGLGSGAKSRTFAGLENYVATLTDPAFLASVGRVLLYGVILVPTMLGLALLFSLLLDARRTGAKGFSRVSIF